MNKKKTVIIAITIAGAVGLFVAAAIIIGALRANQPQPDPPSPTQPPYSYSYEEPEPEAYTEAPTDPATLPSATDAPSTQPPAIPATVTPAPVAPSPDNALPSDAEVMALFSATRISKMSNPDEWLVYLPVNTTSPSRRAGSPTPTRPGGEFAAHWRATAASPAKP